MTDLYGLLPEELEGIVIGMGYERYRADQILYPMYYRYPDSISGIAQLPKALRQQLADEGYTISSSKEVRRVTSGDGDTTKLLLELSGKRSVEAVLMQYPPANPGGHPRSTVCVSTQAGCAMGCVFCATGQMGFESNLEAGDIVYQVVHFAKVLHGRGQHVTNIVFMGMGEPLANYDETIRALRILTHDRGFGIGQRHITVSTIGVPQNIDRLAGEGLQVGLAISLHAPNSDLRKQLVPTASQDSVQELVDAGRRYYNRTKRRVTFEYALIRGINDSAETAKELAMLLRGNGSHVNLIPVNPTAGGFGRPEYGAVLEFERILYNAGINCTVRVEKGTEISAACGQLRTDTAGTRGPEVLK